MQIQSVSIKNFRLLADVELSLEDATTVIVGRNNSGKTSLSEVVRRFLADGSATFQLEDFSSACYDKFCAGLAAQNAGADEDEVRTRIPYIELRLHCTYDAAQGDLGPLADFVIDLNPECTEALVVVRYELKDGAIADFFNGQPAEELDDISRPLFFKAIRERIPALFTTKVWAQDPNDENNRRSLPVASLRSLVKTGFINAQRGLDDVTARESDVLAKVLENLFTTANSTFAGSDDRAIAEALAMAVQDIQAQIDADFGGHLNRLMPTLHDYYPGLGDQALKVETTLDVRRLLSNFTKVRYAGLHGIALPESYNGLGVRNLIFILLQIAGFYKAYCAEQKAPGVHLIFVEEPEAHLHPQMQEAFIRQLPKIARKLMEGTGERVPWPVQFVISTHSSHIANETGFESIRYFLANSEEGTGVRRTVIKNLRDGMSTTPEEQTKFLHQYLTLTRCDLFFADKAVLVEGLSERLLLPVIVRKLAAEDADAPSLATQYVTVMEVGGAYAHLFFGLLDFLELRALIITDLDSVRAPGGKACAVHEGTVSSNACLRNWFGTAAQPSLADLAAKTEVDKCRGKQRIAFQFSEVDGGPCGRTFEDAFVLANAEKFDLAGDTAEARETEALEKASEHKKAEFALLFAINDLDWVAPKYLTEGIKWLAAEPVAAGGADEAIAAAIAVQVGVEGAEAQA